MSWKDRMKSKNLRVFLCGTFSLVFIIFILMASVNGAELITSQYLSKGEISLSESSRVTIDLKGMGEPCIKPIDAVLAIDSTGSMTQSDPSDLRKAVAKDFVSRMDFSKDRAAVVSWDTQAIAWPLTNNSSELADDIKQVDSNGSTDLNVGLASSIVDCPPDSRQLVKQRYLKQTPLRTALEIYSQELNAASSCCTPYQ